MKALIQKELRENIKLAMLGMIIYGLPLLYSYVVYVEDLKDFIRGVHDWSGGGGQPLLGSWFLPGTAFLCPLLGAAFGWFQIHNERQRDLWSFLVHRPMTRTQIFLGKAIAGLVLYLVGAGVPLLVFVGWAITPGHVPAPFEWAMLLPATAMFLTGPAYYFSGMLTGLRQARWYASRAVPLASAIVLSFGAALCPRFWQALLVLGAGAVILGLAAWGAFLSNGYYEGQPKSARPALAVGLAVGMSAVLALTTALVTHVFLGRWLTTPRTSSEYLILRDGTIYRHIVDKNGRVTQLDLNGQHLNLLPNEMHHYTNPTKLSFDVNFGEGEGRVSYFFDQPERTFTETRSTRTGLWYYWGRYGRVVAFNPLTRRVIGSLGPDGYTAGKLSGARFDYPPGVVPNDPSVLKTATTLYEMDPVDRTVKAIFNAPAGDPIGGSARMFEVGHSYTVVAMQHFVYLVSISGEGETFLEKAPYEPAYPAYKSISIYSLSPTNTYAVWFRPSEEAQREARGKLPDHVTFLAPGQSPRSVELPNHPPPFIFDAADKVTSLLTPPLFSALALFPKNRPELPLEGLWFSLASAAFAIPIGWWLARRYSFELAAQLGWAAFLLLLGIPGLLVFLSVQEWPAREKCPNCGKLRIVRRELCEHCNAAFSPAAPTGTEIFETVAE